MHTHTHRPHTRIHDTHMHSHTHADKHHTHTHTHAHTHTHYEQLTGITVDRMTCCIINQRQTELYVHITIYIKCQLHSIQCFTIAICISKNNKCMCIQWKKVGVGHRNRVQLEHKWPNQPSFIIYLAHCMHSKVTCTTYTFKSHMYHVHIQKSHVPRTHSKVTCTTYTFKSHMYHIHIQKSHVPHTQIYCITWPSKNTLVKNTLESLTKDKLKIKKKKCY